MDVTLVRWPSEAIRRSRLMEARRARLLLVEPGAGPPPPIDCLEDWIRVPAAESDIAARLAALSLRSDRHADPVPTVDRDGVLNYGMARLALPPIEARLAAALSERWRAVTSRSAMTRAAWPDGATGRNALDVHVLRMRRRLSPAGLVIRTVRSRGYLLEPAPAARLAVADRV